MCQDSNNLVNDHAADFRQADLEKEELEQILKNLKNDSINVPT